MPETKEQGTPVAQTLTVPEGMPQSGVKAETPDHILFGAGTIHKGLKFAEGWNFAQTLVGATSGGSKFEIVPEVLQVEIDNVTVPLKGLDKKVSESATMEINFVELTSDIMKAGTLGKITKNKAVGFDAIESKEDIEAGDYWDNIAFVGKTVGGKPIIVIMDNALCTSGMAIEGKHKDKGVGKYTFRCSQTIEGNHNTLPYHIYYPAEV